MADSTKLGTYSCVSFGKTPIATEVYSIYPSSPLPADLCLVIFPGNPGVVDFYEVFADYLFTKLGKKYTLLVVGNAGHGASGKNNYQLFTLEDQIHHKIDFLRAVRDGTVSFPNTPQGIVANKGVKFLALAHSIGAYISLKTKARAPDLNIVFNFLLMPTIRHLSYGLSPLIKVACLPYVRNVFSAFAYFNFVRVPLSYLILKFGLRSATAASVSNVVRNKAQYDTVLNALSLAYLEWCNVQHIDDECTQAVKGNPNQTQFIYSPVDPYTPKHFIEQTKVYFPEAYFHVTDSTVEHAFVLRQSEKVADQIVQFMHEYKLHP